MPPKGSTRSGIVPGCKSLDSRSREVEVGFEPRTFRSINPRPNLLNHLAPQIKKMPKYSVGIRRSSVSPSSFGFSHFYNVKELHAHFAAYWCPFHKGNSTGSLRSVEQEKTTAKHFEKMPSHLCNGCPPANTNVCVCQRHSLRFIDHWQLEAPFSQGKPLTRLLKTLRQPMACFTFLGAHQKYTQLQINLVFTRDLTESIVYDILQLNVLHTGRLMIQLARYSRYRSIFS
ncbi:hypothetical protein T265_07947 [Opisthorchis viverrini]|uniref:Uncharacterized protein n=1 Tax=Opisthorchis viverrini TaxID=6198 RepID=A0A074ZLZ7_OPIVI|nr:hypothetical protein T265_07947 [Opisthorchis viverrini]KER24390.1 hypothetical protein T265_07947 [Opisthorchis viverrini]